MRTASGSCVRKVSFVLVSTSPPAVRAMKSITKATIPFVKELLHVSFIRIDAMIRLRLGQQLLLPGRTDCLSHTDVICHILAARFLTRVYSFTLLYDRVTLAT